MYVDADRGFGIVAFHFDPADCERLQKEHADNSRRKFVAELLLCSEIVAGEILPKADGAVCGAANVTRVLGDISLVVVESMFQRISAVAEQPSEKS